MDTSRIFSNNIGSGEYLCCLLNHSKFVLFLYDNVLLRGSYVTVNIVHYLDLLYLNDGRGHIKGCLLMYCHTSLEGIC